MRVAKWGNSLAIRLPASVVEALELKEGEEVEILEVKTLTTAGQPEQWCKIAPPSGEFRWVFGEDAGN